MTNRKPFLKVVGDISKVLYSTIEDKDMFSRRFSETEYSIGLGALGSEMQEGAELFGEMITIGGAMVWLPTDGNDTPDFLIPAKDTGQITIYTGFNVALNGPFNDIFFIASKNPTGISLAEIYSFIFEFAKKNRTLFKGIASVAMISELSGLYSSGLKKSPLKKNKPANNEMVMHKDNIAEWVDLNNDPKFKNEIMISFGIGVDLTSDLSGLNQDLLNSMSYTHPANKGNQKTYLHNHGVVFKKNQPLEKTVYIDDAIKKFLVDGEFLDMRHLLDNTKVDNAVFGVSYIADIVKE